MLCTATAGRLVRWGAGVLALAGAGSARANSTPEIASLPALSATTLVADDTTVYTLTLTATDADGYADIRDVRALFNLIEEIQSPGGLGRGYLVWGVTDDDVNYYNDGTWVTADATGGGRWGYLANGWGGTTCMTPVGCSTSVAGAASGASGSRTVVFSFRAKPAWAADPLVNDADAYARDNATFSGWQENPSEFAVVGASCSSYAATPSAPVVTGVTAATADVAIDPADSATDLFAICASDGNDDRYVQTDGSLGLVATFQTRGDWGTTTVRGLESDMGYDFCAQAYSGGAGNCPSAFGPATSITTAMATLTVDLSATGQAISPLVTGSATRVDVIPDFIWGILDNTMARGVAGGLDADTYNWKDMSGQGVGHTGTVWPHIPTTLDWLCSVRDHGSTPVITANARGIGPLASSGYGSFYYSDVSIATVSQLAADWVRYINHILPTYRQGDTLPAGDQAILDSIAWYGKPTLLAPGEPSTPTVTYWEIGNEPEVGLPFHTPGVPVYGFSPAEYVSRYKQIADAMLAVDPTIKVGPCIMEAPNGSNSYLSPLLADSAAVVDLIGYHPYGPLRGRSQIYGDTEDAAEGGLQFVREEQIEIHTGIQSCITSNGRDANAIELIASEWNASDWAWEREPQIQRVSHALGLAETVWSFADLGLVGATYWSWWPISDQTPGPMIMDMLGQHFGTTLLGKLVDDPNLRLYTARDDAAGEAVVWALNFSNDTDKDVSLSFPDHILDGAELWRLANVTGPTSLFDINETGTTDPLVDWVLQTPPSFQNGSCELSVPRATATVLVLAYHPPFTGDFDGDDDVDLADFGVMQRCLTGADVPQGEPECARTRLDGDNDVDGYDLNAFVNCLSGEGVLPPPGCAN